MRRLKMFILLAVILVGTAVGRPITPQLVDGLYVAARHHSPPPPGAGPLYGASTYRIVPYHQMFFAITNHGVRDTPHYEVFEYKSGTWRFIFGYDALVEGTPAEQQAATNHIRNLWASSGFSQSMQDQLVTGNFDFFPPLRKIEAAKRDPHDPVPGWQEP